MARMLNYKNEFKEDFEKFKKELVYELNNRTLFMKINLKDFFLLENSMISKQNINDFSYFFKIHTPRGVYETDDVKFDFQNFIYNLKENIYNKFVKNPQDKMPSLDHIVIFNALPWKRYDTKVKVKFVDSGLPLFVVDSSIPGMDYVSPISIIYLKNQTNPNKDIITLDYEIDLSNMNEMDNNSQKDLLNYQMEINQDYIKQRKKIFSSLGKGTIFTSVDDLIDEFLEMYHKPPKFLSQNDIITTSAYFFKREIESHCNDQLLRLLPMFLEPIPEQKYN